MRKRAALYPFDAELLPIARHFNRLQTEYHLVSLIAPLGYSNIGKDGGFTANQPDIGFVVEEEDSFRSEQWEYLIVIKERMVEIDLKYIESVLSANKKVVFYISGNDSFLEEVKILQKQYQKSLIIVENTVMSSDTSNDVELMNVPVILVGGLLKRADVTEVIFKLSEYLRADGKQIDVYTNTAASSLFGFYSLLPLMEMDNNENNKTETIRTMISQNASKNYPDVIIIEAPDAVMKYSEVVPNDYGIRTYIISQAIAIDYFICCIPFELVQPKMIESLSQKMSFHLDCPISAVHASNIILDVSETLERKEIHIVHVPISTVDEWLNATDFSIPCFNMITEHMEKVIEQL